MNLTEGANRMQRAGRTMVTIALCAFTLCALLSAIYAFLPSSAHSAVFFGVVSPLIFTVIWISAMTIAVGTVLWIAGWILEGFAKSQ
jgi:hypothetical protein